MLNPLSVPLTYSVVDQASFDAETCPPVIYTGKTCCGHIIR